MSVSYCKDSTCALSFYTLDFECARTHRVYFTAGWPEVTSNTLGEEDFLHLVQINQKECGTFMNILSVMQLMAAPLRCSVSVDSKKEIAENRDFAD